jgi:hypothetical protein
VRTAGFAANYWYCASDSGLSRGFTTYRDYIFPRLTALKTAAVVDRALLGIQRLASFFSDQLDVDLLGPVVRRLWWLIKADRKHAGVINGEFLDWLRTRSQPQRPFFAFLNYYDAHHPYQLRPTGIYRFGADSGDDRASDPIQELLVVGQLALSRDPLDPDPGQVLRRRWPMASLNEDDWSYIRHEGSGREELFSLRAAPHESQNLAADPAMRATLDRMRQVLYRLTADPLGPGDIKP